LTFCSAVLGFSRVKAIVIATISTMAAQAPAKQAALAALADMAWQTRAAESR
jgi:hypothetical protein